MSVSVTEAHRTAMELADAADAAKRGGDTEAAVCFFGEAFVWESGAALSLRDNTEDEPSRSVLFRSAASLALSAGLPRDARRMIEYGLLGDPPEEIAQELRDLLKAAAQVERQAEDRA